MLRPQVLLLQLIALLGCYQSAQASAPTFDRPKWPKNVPIPYFMNTTFNESEQTEIRNAMTVIAEHSCLDFKEDDTRSVGQIEFAPGDGGCDGQVGYRGSGEDKENTIVTLGKNCGYDRPTPIIHEVMHALGFRHTQTRHDRDKYVTVNESLWYYPTGGPNTNYIKMDVLNGTTDYGVPYEFNSALHYPRRAGLLEAVDPDYTMSLGGLFMTFVDWKVLNLHYNCQENCTAPVICQNGGFENPRKCGECVCPLFYTGALCTEEIGVLTLKSGEPMQQHYEFNQDYEIYRVDTKSFDEYDKSPVHLIKAPANTLIRVTITDIKDPWRVGVVGGNYRSNCNDQAVEIVDGDLSRTGKRFCALSHIGRSFVSEKSVVGFRMFTHPGSGFSANVTFTVEGTPANPETVPPTVITTTETAQPETDDEEQESEDPDGLED